jgi:SAM-dependent methyltransferase/uncharacterized protein YbaR (Trm112 family)
MIFENYLYIAARIDRRKAKRFCAALSGVVVDVGCGPQPYAQYLPAGCTYVGVESDDRLEPDVVGDVFALPIRSGAADSAMCNEVLEHVPDPAAALAEIARIVRPGGALYMTVPQSWGLHYEPNDYYRYTPYGIRHLLEGAGFRVVRVEQMGGLFSHFLVRLLDLVVARALFPLCDRIGLVRGRYRLAALLCLPANVLLGPVVDALDRTDRLNAYGWATLAERVPADSAVVAAADGVAGAPIAALRRPELGPLLACPNCGGVLEPRGRTDGSQEIVCGSCATGYAVRSGIPVLVRP